MSEGYNRHVAGMAGDVIAAQLTEFFARHPDGIVAAYLFGSVARGTATAVSDVDVAVLFEECPPRTLSGRHADLAGALEGALNRRVDLVILNRAPVDLVHRVMRDGRLVMDRLPSARIRVEVRARNDYFDLKPILDRCRRARAATGGKTTA
jgi:uncharacterized protein